MTAPVQSAYPRNVAPSPAIRTLVHPTAGILELGASIDARCAVEVYSTVTNGPPTPAQRAPVPKEPSTGAQHYLERAIAASGTKPFKFNPDVEATFLDVTHKVRHGAPTDQKASGRCWIFSGLNMLRAGVLDKYGKSFAYSQNYTAYWDKYERANWYLERMIGLAWEPVDGRDALEIRDWAFSDGGEWSLFKNVIAKYGVVPDYAMKETAFTGKSGVYMSILEGLLREQGAVLQGMVRDGASDDAIQAYKNAVLERVQRVLDSYLGHPPRAFRWQEPKDLDGDGKPHDRAARQQTQMGQDGALCYVHARYRQQEPVAKIRDMTPLELLADNPLKLDDLAEVCMFAEEKPNTWLRVPDATNVVEGQCHQSLNMDMEDALAAIRRAIKDGVPVMCATETRHRDLEKKLWSVDNDQTDQILGLDDLPRLSKAERLQNGVTTIAHGMVFVGCDDEDRQRYAGDPAKRVDTDGPLWLVENSWKGATEVYMTDAWVREHLYAAVIPKKYLDAKHRAAAEDPFTPHIDLPRWHYMGRI